MNSTRNVIPVTSHIIILSVGSVDILIIIYAVPTIPISGSTGPNGTLKFLGAFGSLFLKLLLPSSFQALLKITYLTYPFFRA